MATWLQIRSQPRSACLTKWGCAAAYMWPSGVATTTPIDSGFVQRLRNLQPLLCYGIAIGMSSTHSRKFPSILALRACARFCFSGIFIRTTRFLWQLQLHLEVFHWTRESTVICVDWNGNTTNLYKHESRAVTSTAEYERTIKYLRNEAGGFPSRSQRPERCSSKRTTWCYRVFVSSGGRVIRAIKKSLMWLYFIEDGI